MDSGPPAQASPSQGHPSPAPNQISTDDHSDDSNDEDSQSNSSEEKSTTSSHDEEVQEGGKNEGWFRGRCIRNHVASYWKDPCNHLAQIIGILVATMGVIVAIVVPIAVRKAAGGNSAPVVAPPDNSHRSGTIAHCGDALLNMNTGNEEYDVRACYGVPRLPPGEKGGKWFRIPTGDGDIPDSSSACVGLSIVDEDLRRLTRVRVFVDNEGDLQCIAGEPNKKKETIFFPPEKNTRYHFAFVDGPESHSFDMKIECLLECPPAPIPGFEPPTSSPTGLNSTSQPTGLEPPTFAPTSVAPQHLFRKLILWGNNGCLDTRFRSCRIGRTCKRVFINNTCNEEEASQRWYWNNVTNEVTNLENDWCLTHDATRGNLLVTECERGQQEVTQMWGWDESRLYSFKDGLCVDLDPDTATTVLRGCHDGVYQKFRIAGESGEIKLKQDTSLCMAVVQHGATTDEQLVLKNSWNGDIDELVLYEEGSSSRQNVLLYPCNNETEQRWYWDGQGNSKQILNMQSNKCLEYNNLRAGEQNLQVDDCHGGDTQKWRWDNDGTHLISVYDDGKCIGMTVPDGNLRLFDCSSDDWKQQFIWPEHFFF